MSKLTLFVAGILMSAGVLVPVVAWAGNAAPSWLRIGTVQRFSVCNGDRGGPGVQVWSSASGHGKGLVCKSGRVFGSRTP